MEMYFRGRLIQLPKKIKIVFTASSWVGFSRKPFTLHIPYRVDIMNFDVSTAREISNRTNSNIKSIPLIENNNILTREELGIPEYTDDKGQYKRVVYNNQWRTLLLDNKMHYKINRLGCIVEGQDFYFGRYINNVKLIPNSMPVDHTYIELWLTEWRDGYYPIDEEKEWL